jgi:hypothetical protein
MATILDPRNMHGLAQQALLAVNRWPAAIGRQGTIPPAGAYQARAARNG